MFAINRLTWWLKSLNKSPSFKSTSSLNMPFSSIFSTSSKTAGSVPRIDLAGTKADRPNKEMPDPVRYQPHQCGFIWRSKGSKLFEYSHDTIAKCGARIDVKRYAVPGFRTPMPGCEDNKLLPPAKGKASFHSVCHCRFLFSPYRRQLCLIEYD